MSNTKEMLAWREEMLAEGFIKGIEFVAKGQQSLPGLEDYDGTGNPQEAAARQVGGDHYNMVIQPIEYITKNGMGYLEGNVIKYVSRHKSKNGLQDIEKAIHYLEFIKEQYVK